MSGGRDGSGAFFIRRAMHSSTSPDSDLYKALLAQYVHQLVHGGHSMEFFLEGGRSRDGKVSSSRPSG